MYLLPDGMTMADVRRMDAELLASEGIDLLPPEEVAPMRRRVTLSRDDKIDLALLSLFLAAAAALAYTLRLGR